MSYSSRISIVMSVLVLSLTISLAAQTSIGEGLLNEGDSIDVFVNVEDFKQLKSGRAGSTVEIRILNNVDRYGKSFIKKLEIVYCTVTDRGRGGMYGKAGKMTISIDSTHSSAGTMIPLRGSASFTGKGKKTFAYILFPFGWAIKGSDIVFPEGKNTFKPVVAADTPLKYLR